MKRIYLFAVIIFMLLSCKEDDTFQTEEHNVHIDWGNHQPFTTSYPTFNMPFTQDFNATPESLGGVNLSEISGMAYSANNPGMIWAHNDSGHPNVIFLLNAKNGDIVARYTLKGSNNVDWEDMEITIDPNNGEAYLYIGDIGDNAEKRQSYSIYKFKYCQAFLSNIFKYFLWLNLGVFV